WTGDVPSGHENDNPITITMDSDKTITASFIRQYTLTITAGTGGRTNPSSGTYTHDVGTQVSVRAIANSGYRFIGWSGDASGTTNPITINIDSNKSIKANFNRTTTGGGGETEKKGGCFIATAAYGSSLHPYIRSLQDFRDKYIMSHKFGRKLVNLYYKYSPFVADLITKHRLLKPVIRVHLLPVIVFSYSMVHYGPIVTAAILVMMFAIPIFFISISSKKLRRRRSVA
ncbi:MAG: CFI-box-CTERM domain-containing protein, partial [Candidatus Hodarchaeota archaeon]